MVCILTFTLNFPLAVEIKPSIDLPVIFAGKFLTHWPSGFVVDDSIGFAVKIDVLFDPLDLSAGVVIDPAIHFAIAIGILLLARHAAALVIVKTCDRLL